MRKSSGLARSHKDRGRSSGESPVSSSLDVLAAAWVVAPHVLSTPMAVVPSKRHSSSVRSPLPSVRTAPLAAFRGPRALGDTGDGEVLNHPIFQCPPQALARDLRPPLGLKFWRFRLLCG